MLQKMKFDVVINRTIRNDFMPMISLIVTQVRSWSRLSYFLSRKSEQRVKKFHWSNSERRIKCFFSQVSMHIFGQVLHLFTDSSLDCQRIVMKSQIDSSETWEQMYTFDFKFFWSVYFTNFLLKINCTWNFYSFSSKIIESLRWNALRNIGHSSTNEQKTMDDWIFTVQRWTYTNVGKKTMISSVLSNARLLSLYEYSINHHIQIHAWWNIVSKFDPLEIHLKKINW